MLKAVVVAGMIAFVLGGSAAAAAKPLSMTCKNPHREYKVRFDKESKFFRADDTLYTVKAVEDEQGHLVVEGLTGQGGPNFRAEFRPYKKIDFYNGDELFQTDACR